MGNHRTPRRGLYLALAIALLFCTVSWQTASAQEAKGYFTLENLSNKPLHFLQIDLCLGPSVVNSTLYCEQILYLASRDQYEQRNIDKPETRLVELALGPEARLLPGEVFTTKALKVVGARLTSLSVSGCAPITEGDCAAYSWAVTGVEWPGSFEEFYLRDGTTFYQRWGDERITKLTFYVGKPPQP